MQFLQFSKMLLYVILSVLIAGSFEGAMSEVTPKTPENVIIGGERADIKDHPYQLRLQSSLDQLCGASIIADKWALTAAHCVRLPANEYSIYAGSSDKDQGTLYSVKNITIHPQFNITTKDYDVAAIEIVGTFQFNENVQPIRLAKKELPPGTMANVTGWGTTWDGGSHSQNLMRVSIPIIDRETCRSYYSDAKVVITESMVCAGYEEGGKNTCRGDSGGPLATNNILYGIVSWSRGCAQPKSPTVYTNIPSFHQWMRETTGI